MRHIILFCYMFAIFFGVAGITMVFLAGRKRQSKLNTALKVFLCCMLLMSLYDMLIYYTDYIIGDIHATSLLRIGNCIIAMLFAAWLNLQQKLIDSTSFKRYNRGVGIFIAAYVVTWLFCTFVLRDSFYGAKWLLLVSDIILLLVVLVGSVVYMGEAVWSHKRKMLLYYMVVVTSMLVWNFASYFWGETSVYWGNSQFIREPLDLTIIFWFVVNISTLIIIYKTEFSTAYANEHVGAEAFNLEERLNQVATQYDLTAREKELVNLIYEGNSNADISAKLFISESTVKTHIYNIFRKLQVKNRVGVICTVRGETENVPGQE